MVGFYFFAITFFIYYTTTRRIARIISRLIAVLTFHGVKALNGLTRVIKLIYALHRFMDIDNKVQL